MGDGGAGGCVPRESRGGRVSRRHPMTRSLSWHKWIFVFPSGSIAGWWRCPVRQGPPGYTRAMEPPAAMEPA